jgi:hypothetical protein
MGQFPQERALRADQLVQLTPRGRRSPQPHLSFGPNATKGQAAMQPAEADSLAVQRYVILGLLLVLATFRRKIGRGNRPLV